MIGDISGRRVYPPPARIVIYVPGSAPRLPDDAGREPTDARIAPGAWHLFGSHHRYGLFQAAAAGESSETTERRRIRSRPSNAKA